MKKLMIIALIILSGKLAFAQNEKTSQSPIPLVIVENYFVDSIKVYSIKNDSLKKTYKYDENGKRVLELTEIRIDGQWVGKEKYTCAYNSREKKVSDIREIWVEDQWIGKERNFWTYHSSGYPTFYLKQIFRNNEWEGSKRAIWKYDSNKRLVNLFNEIMYNDEWKGDIRENWTYDDNGNELTYLKEQNLSYAYDEWVKVEDDLRIYQTNSNLIYERLENCEWFFGGIKERYLRIDSFDTRGNRIYYIELLKGNDYFSHNYKKSWTYDAKDNILSYTYQSAEWTDINYQNELRFVYTYDSSNNRLTEIYEEAGDNNWTPKYRRSWSYSFYGDTLSKQLDNWVNNEWIYETRYIYSYLKSKMQSEQKEIWQSDIWIPDERKLWTYNSQDLLIQKAIDLWKDNQWSKYRIDSWAYNAEGLNILYTIEMNNVWLWEIIYRETRSYESNESGVYLIRLYSEQKMGEHVGIFFPKEDIRWRYDNEGRLQCKSYQEYFLPTGQHEGFWNSGNVLDLSYDENGYLIKNKYRTWDTGPYHEGHQQIWTTAYNYNYLNDPNGNLLMISSDDDDSTWVEKILEFKDKVGFTYIFESYKLEIFYTKVTDVEEELIAPINEVLIFPNPVKNDCNINLRSGDLQSVVIQIYNLRGDKLYGIEVQINEGDNIIPLNTSELSSGLYSIVISYPDKVKRGMFLKE